MITFLIMSLKNGNIKLFFAGYALLDNTVTPPGLMVSPLIFVFVLNDNGTWTFFSKCFSCITRAKWSPCLFWIFKRNSSNKNLHNKNSIPHVVAYTRCSCSLCQSCFCEGNLIWPTVNAENVSTDSLLVCHQTEFRLRIEVHNILQYIAAIWYQEIVSKKYVNTFSAVLWCQFDVLMIHVLVIPSRIFHIIIIII